jgi:catechol 2,3-dioxygenase-like lactoylglutathione lyase family enzyme
MPAGLVSRAVRREDRPSRPLPWLGSFPEVVSMLSECSVVATIPVSDLARVRSFYLETLGLKPLEERQDELSFECADGTSFAVFVSQGRTSGTHTQLSFICRDLDAEVADLRARGVKFEEFDMPGVEGRDGIYELDGERGAWFRDPEGNLLAVAERTSGRP